MSIGFVAAPLAIVGTGPAVVLGTGGAGRVGADKASNRKIPHRKYLDFRKQHGQSWSREKLNAENFTFKN
jgi:hypothetical protein